MKSLMKYVSFVEFLLKIDENRYYKFNNIRKWILSKRSYPTEVIKRTEDAILMQYKNLLLENKVKIPQSITDTFAPSIDLCSDDEEKDSRSKETDRVHKNSAIKQKKRRKHSNIKRDYKVPTELDDADDDLEIVSVDYLTKAEESKEHQPVQKTSVGKEEYDIDKASRDILNKIDQIAADEKLKSFVHEPVDYTFKMECENSNSAEHGNDIIFQRRSPKADTLFKRRTDFTGDEVIVESLNDDKPLLFSGKQVETIALDSDSESEVCNDAEKQSTSKSQSSCKEMKAKNVEAENDNTDSNSNGSSCAKNIEKLELLCSSIESVLPEMSDILKEVEEINSATSCRETEKAVVLKESNKENVMEESDGLPGTINLDPEQISKVLEDISSKTDFEIDTFYEALQCVRQMNSEQRTVPETPPPAPPPTATASTTELPAANSYEQPIAVCNDSNVNFVPTMPPALKPKLNINDPRIKKQLQVIKNSPIFSYNLLKYDLEESIRKICHETVMQPSTLNVNIKGTELSAPNTSVPVTNKSTITYGEYKRRQLEKKLEMERKREEERKAKNKERLELEEREKLEQSEKKNVQDIRSQILSTLDPCKEALYSMWKQKNSPAELQQLKTEQNRKEKNTKELQQEENTQTKNVHSAKEATNKKQNKSKKSSDQKLNRIYSELKCTVKGFDQIQDYIADEVNKDSTETSSNPNYSPTREEPNMARFIGLRRRSSMHALSAITEQLGLQSDFSDSELSENSSKRRSKNCSNYSSSDGLSQDSIYSLPKRRKTIDEPNRGTKIYRIADSDTSSSDGEEAMHNNLKKKFSSKVPLIKLQRMSNEFIRKHTKGARKDSADVPTSTSSVRLKKTSEIVESLQEPSHKMPKLKKYNNDCQMTERSTAFCVLCRSKPTDLTNHYKGRHKTESYISRLDWSDLEDLAVNTHFATLLPNTKNYRYERYEVECPFCKEKVVDQFISLYNHYSVHTGEYAFQCSHCSLAKPYKPDIQSHILHSKTCRNATIQIMYRYPPQAQCIYLNYCIICNFVQLNEANVLKHLREHHHPSKAVQSNVQKCILAAISDGPDACQTKNSISSLPATEVKSPTADLDANPSPSPKKAETIVAPTRSQMKFKVDDDDIPVSNEPCVEEEFPDNERNTCEAMLSYLHREPVKPIQPMTVIHNVTSNFNLNATQTITQQQQLPAAELQHLRPIQIKNEHPGNLEEKPKLPPPTTSSKPKQLVARNVNSVYEKYRSYPPNTNYLGLFKCMTDDCYYSSDSSSDIITHLTEHSADAPHQYLQCPYCSFTSDTPITPAQLVDHVRTQHGNLNFQCSLCCYRSCDASNVDLHQQMHHSGVLNTCKIYKTSTDDLHISSRKNLNEKIEQNVYKISCKICGNASYYHTQLLINHLYSDHNLTSANSLNIYSCINCPFTVDNKKQLRLHIATKHPGEFPLIYDHNAQINSSSEDSKSCANIINISEPVPYVETNNDTITAGQAEQSLSQDIKPDFGELLMMNEETAKVRLRKLTAHTGIAPDNLYRCPEQSCGGFFSNAELWLRHMKARHLKLECQCPHCPMAVVLPLEQFANHFEQHRRHTYICFYCSTTSPTESLARKHAAQNHSEFRQMRFERITFNISYSYWIVIQRELYEDRDKFIAEFLTVLDERLNEMERNEIKNLKQQWPIRENTPWFDDYIQNLPKRKVARRCLVKDCNFRTLREETLYRHLSTSHTITGTQFNCSKCDYHVERCSNLDELFNHIKLHNEYHFICAACSLVTSSRPKISAHIEEQHSARDVPVIHLYRTTDEMYHKIYIVFADNNLTFSTMKNCFCCPERNMSGDVLNLHLKRYHNLSLTYYCENCTNFSFKSLQEVKPHFDLFHNTDKFKIRCELAGHHDLHVVSLNNFQVEIVRPPLPLSQQNFSSMPVKNEPLDASDSDNVVLIEEDDVVIENSLKAAQEKQAELPKLKCASFSKLLEPNVNAQQAKKPRLKCAAFSKMVEPHTTMPTVLQTHTFAPGMQVTASLRMPAHPPSQGYYNNLGQPNLNPTPNPVSNSITALKHMHAALSTQNINTNNNNFVIFNGAIIRPVEPSGNNIISTLPSVGSMPLNENIPNSFHNNITLPGQYVGQTSNNAFVIQHNVQNSNSTNHSIRQNYEYNNNFRK